MIDNNKKISKECEKMSLKISNSMASKHIQRIDSEISDDYSDDSLFNITSWGADLSFRELITMYDEDELLKPELQRNYVWDRTEASRFIESLLMGLPVPSIFLAQSNSNKLIVDGYQRIMTVYDFVRGIFSGDGKVFKLSISNKINERWRGKAFSELSVDDQRKIKSTTIHAIIFEQKHPKNNDTSMYQVFERINTSGRTLTPQEIRNCVYQGTLNSLLIELNEDIKWRNLFGTSNPDNRMRDLEYILRFFAIHNFRKKEITSKQISLKKELNEFMGMHKNANADIIERMRVQFLDTINVIYDTLGENAFMNYSDGKYLNRFHPTIFDAIAVAVSLTIEKDSQYSINSFNHIALLQNEEFKNVTSIRTTDVENIHRRIDIAIKYLVG